MLLAAGQAQAVTPEVRADGDALEIAQRVGADLGDLADVVADASGVVADLTPDARVALPLAGSGAVVLERDGKPDLSLSLPRQARVMDAVVDDSGAVVYNAASRRDATVVVEPLASGEVSIQTVIPDASAGERYTYTLDGGVTAVVREDGGLDLLARDEASGLRLQVGSVDAPWAFDASGAAVPTRYEVSGSTFTQVVDLSGAPVYPVVADPTYGHTYGIPTAYLSRSETKKAAGDTAGVNLICAAIGLWNAAAGVVCAANVYAINDGAKRARSNGKCTKLLLNIVVLPQEFTCQS